MTKIVESFAPGRICLLGDKSDLLGRPVIAAAVSNFVHFEISPSSDQNLYFYNRDHNKRFSRPFDTLVEDEFFKFFSHICWRLKNKISPISCTTYGELPIGCGLSSSAACSVGFIRGLSSMFSLSLSNKEIAELAFQVERNDLGIACGRMDQYSIAFGGVTFIETGNETKVSTIKTKSLPFVIGDSCEPRHAKVILNKTMKHLEEKDEEWLGFYDLVNQYVVEGYEAILKEDDIKLGELMNKHQIVEKKMGASTRRIDAMCEAANLAGALGAKQVGAGGGGCMIAFAPQHQERIISALQACGGKAWAASLFIYPS